MFTFASTGAKTSQSLETATTRYDSVTARNNQTHVERTTCVGPRKARLVAYGI